jgi:hypothetical protein
MALKVSDLKVNNDYYLLSKDKLFTVKTTDVSVEKDIVSFCKTYIDRNEDGLLDTFKTDESGSATRSEFVRMANDATEHCENIKKRAVESARNDSKKTVFSYDIKDTFFDKKGTKSLVCGITKLNY